MDVLVLAMTRIASILYSNVQDCDEIFNYFEPLHYWQHHVGFQTWEYVYRLRSWFYLAMHSIPYTDKITQFYLIRGWIGLWSFLSIWYFKRKLTLINPEVAAYFTLFSLAPGMFIASSAFLPSTFGMIFLTFAYSNSLSTETSSMLACILATTISGLWGWPFCLFYGFIYIVQRLFDGTLVKRFLTMVLAALLSLLLISLPIVWFDSSIYKNWTVASWNLVKYNLFSDAGPDLYGVEPWSFYFLNGILNFNVAFLLALLSLPVLLVEYVIQGKLRGWINHIVPLYLWIGMFSMQPHKEERFMYVAFPLVCVNAAICFHALKVMLEFGALNLKPLRTWTFRITRLFRWTVIITFIVLSVLRIYSQYRFYHAPLDVYPELQKYNPNSTSRMEVVCVGKEWYRFPSHYFVPSGMRVEFIRSRFKGLLPTHFQQIEVTSSTFADWSEYAEYLRTMPRNFTYVPANVNDQNRHEDDRYVRSFNVGGT
jgi:alpha-1,2-mannosyltransferase